MMKNHFSKELSALLNRLNVQGTRVAEATERAFSAFASKDADAARTIIDCDKFIDREEICIEEECLKLLALYQPVAIDLRTLVSILKINTSLERMADFAAHMAERAIDISARACPPQEDIFDFAPMHKVVQSMLHDTLTVICRSDMDVAYRVIEQDNTVDTMRTEHRNHVRQALARCPMHADYLMDCHGLARDLERIADLCTDICEHIIYLRTASIVRHSF